VIRVRVCVRRVRDFVLVVHLGRLRAYALVVLELGSLCRRCRVALHLIGGAEQGVGALILVVGMRGRFFGRGDVRGRRRRQGDRFFLGFSRTGDARRLLILLRVRRSRQCGGVFLFLLRVLGRRLCGCAWDRMGQQGAGLVVRRVVALRG